LREVAGFRKWFFSEDGVPNARFEKLSRMVSVDSMSPLPNINGATEETLTSLCDEVGCDPRGVIQWRTGGGHSPGGVFRNPVDLKKAGVPIVLGERVSFTVSMVRIRTRASKGEADVVLDALIDGAGEVVRINEDSESQLPSTAGRTAD
jgi:hypothetical protein